MTTTIVIRREPFDLAAEMRALRARCPDAGAIVSFTGVCRSEDGALAALELEHYAGMAEEELTRVAADAEARWPALQGATIMHRHGKIPPGEDIVLVITASPHRRAAFEAAEFLMDYLKTRAPFWKKEHRVDGSSGEWVAATDADDRAAERWTR